MMCHVSQYYEWLPWCDHWDDVEAAPTMEAKTAVLWEREKRAAAVQARQFADRLPDLAHTDDTESFPHQFGLWKTPVAKIGTSDPFSAVDLVGMRADMMTEL